MAFTMHSHSGQFCPGHAKDQLEEVILHAIKTGYKTMGLTEHMPRTHLEDLYPEELSPDPAASLAVLFPRHEEYVREARRLQAKYAARISLLVGFEAEFIRPAYGPLVRDLASGVHPSAVGGADYFIGSLHHTAGVPIDFDKEHYARAMAAAGGSEEAIYEKYYDEQFEMLQALRPPVVGHFDLVRLLSSDPGRDVRAWSPAVWAKIRRNLEEVVSYGGWLECNSSALRKGLAEPYPARFIAEEWLRLGGKFTFSDDSHGIAQVATNYGRALDYLESLGVEEVWTFERRPGAAATSGPQTNGETNGDSAKAWHLVKKSVKLSEFRKDLKVEKS